MSVGETKVFAEGRYEVREMLGHGAMGIVYRAFDKVMNRLVAIKTIQTDDIPPESLDDFQQMFLAEAQAAGRLDHPGIVPAYDYGSSGSEPYIIMPLIEGGSLRDIFNSGVQLSIREVVELGVQVAEALDYAHQNSIRAHCDIKPGNIFLTAEGRYKVGDFGIAHPLRMNEFSGVHEFYSGGTPRYMSPEQITNPDSVDGRSDLFSLCVILYEALTGEYPYSEVDVHYDPERNPTAGRDQAKKVFAMPASLRTRMPDLPAGLSKAIDRGLHPNRNERFSTCGEFAVELRRIEEMLKRPPRPIYLPTPTAPAHAPEKRAMPAPHGVATEPVAEGPQENQLVTAIIVALIAGVLLFFWFYSPE